MKGFVIPSVFTAIDKMTAPIRKMSSEVTSFANKANASIARADRSFRKIGESAQNIGRKSAIMGVAIAAPLIFATKSAIDFEANMSNISTIIDTSKESMSSMSEEVLKMSTQLPVSIEDLTKSLYDIRSAGIPAEKAMGLLTDSAKLATSGLSTASEATDIMTSAINAFSSEALTTAEISDILFKTTKYGKTTIAQMSEAFGATAPVIQASGVSLREFSAATAALTTVGTPAAQAQNMIRAAIVKLEKPTGELQKIFKKLGVTTGQELIKKTGGLEGSFQAIKSTAGQMNINLAEALGSVEALGAVVSLTGSTNQIYLETLKDMTTGTNAIDEAFKKQMETGKAQAQLAKNNFEAISITIGTILIPVLNDLIQEVMPIVQRFGEWVKRNKETVKTVLKIVGAIAGLSLAVSGISFLISALSKTIYIAKGAMFLFNVAVGISSVIQGKAAFALRGNVVAMTAYRVAAKIAAAAQWLWNAAMSANPIVLLIAGVAALAVGVYALSKAFKTQSAAERVHEELQQRILDNTIEQRTEAAVLFAQLRNTTQGTKEYASILKKIDEMQPGIVDKYNLQTKAIKNINEAEKELMKSIMKRAEMQARTELIQEKTKALLTMQQEGPSFAQKLQGGLSDKVYQADMINLQKEIDVLIKDQVSAQAVNPEKAKQEALVNTIQTNGNLKGDITLNINDKKGLTSVADKSDFIKVNTSSTMGN